MGVVMISDTFSFGHHSRRRRESDADSTSVTDKQMGESSVMHGLEELNIVCYRHADGGRWECIDPWLVA
jgi:hypothetical protein